MPKPIRAVPVARTASDRRRPVGRALRLERGCGGGVIRLALRQERWQRRRRGQRRQLRRPSGSWRRNANHAFSALPWGAPWPAGNVHDSPLSGRRARGTWRDRPLIHARRGILSEGPDAKSAGARDRLRRLQPDHRSGQAHADGPRTSGRRRLQHAGRRANRCTDRDSPSSHATSFAIRQSCCGCSHE